MQQPYDFSGPTPLAAVLSQLPEPRSVSRDELHRAREQDGSPTFVVFDDDPTGTQPVSGVPVLTAWADEDFEWAFRSGSPVVYVLSNSRGLLAARVAQIIEEAAGAAMRVASRLGREIVFVSRSDSTLRGHFPLEIEVLSRAMRSTASELGHAPREFVILAPAYLEAGRVTLQGEHLVTIDGSLLRVDQTDYAKDRSFAFSSSVLREYIAEKTGTIGEGSVLHTGLDALRSQPLAVVVERILASEARYLTFDAMSPSDLETLTLVVHALRAGGASVLIQSGPSLPRMLGALPEPERLTADRLAENASDAGDLIVVGSHVPMTTAQLEQLKATEGLVDLHIEIDVGELANSRAPEADFADSIRELVSCLRAGGRAVLSTSRAVRTIGDSDANLTFATSVSKGITTIVREVLGQVAPRTLLAKGGITSSDLATDALGIRRAWVLGPVLDGIISVWRAEDGRYSGTPFIVFAGNVGDEGSLVDVVRQLAPVPGSV